MAMITLRTRVLRLGIAAIAASLMLASCGVPEQGAAQADPGATVERGAEASDESVDEPAAPDSESDAEPDADDLAEEGLGAFDDDGDDDICDDVYGWDADSESSEIGLNAPMIGISGANEGCYDSLTLDLDPAAGSPGYIIGYVFDVTAQGSGEAIPLAGGAAIQVIIDSATHDEDFASTLPAAVDLENMVDVADFGVVRQVGFGGSFEGMTTIGIGVESEQPFIVEVTSQQLTIKIAHGSGDSGDAESAVPADDRVTDSGVLPASVCHAIDVEMRANLLLDDFELGGRTDPLTSDEVGDYFIPVDRIWEEVTPDFQERINDLRTFMLTLVGMDAADVVDELQGPVYRDTVRPVFWGIMTEC